jgi:DNA-binding MarR family transcriptional regulator
MADLSQSDYERLLDLRTGLRRFLRWSENEAQAAGLTAAQHQLLLAVRGHPGPLGPTVGDIAEYLALRHHSAVGLIDRAEAAGLVRRTADPSSRSTVRVALTPLAVEKLSQLSQSHLAELARLAPLMQALWSSFEAAGDASLNV